MARPSGSSCRSQSVAEPQYPIQRSNGGGPSARRAVPRILRGRQRLTAANDNGPNLRVARLLIYAGGVVALGALALIVSMM